jgi:hypothetical protein
VLLVHFNSGIDSLFFLICETIPLPKGSASFPFKKAQLTIALEAEKVCVFIQSKNTSSLQLFIVVFSLSIQVRSSETSDEGVEGLIGQEMTFDTDLFIERQPQFRLKEKDVTMSPDFGRSAKVGEGQLTLNTTHTQFPSTVRVSMRSFLLLLLSSHIIRLSV